MGKRPFLAVVALASLAATGLVYRSTAIRDLPAAASGSSIKQSTAAGLTPSQNNAALQRPDFARELGDEQQRFLHRTRIATLRQLMPGVSLPQEILNALGDGRMKEATDALLNLAKAGDFDAAALLAMYSATCSVEVETLDYAALRERWSARARGLGRSQDVIDRVNLLLAAQEIDFRERQSIDCPAIKATLQSVAASTVEEYFGMSIAALLKKFSPQDSTPDDEMTHKRAAAGSAQAQYQLGTNLIASTDRTQQAAGVQWLQRAAESIPFAKTLLAICEMKGCPDPGGDIDHAQKLLTEAALAGDYQTLSAMTGEGYWADSLRSNRLALSADQAYAWNQFFESLNEAGCYGGPNYNAWAISKGPGVTLGSLSPHDSTIAKAAAQDLLHQLPHARRLLGCES